MALVQLVIGFTAALGRPKVPTRRPSYKLSLFFRSIVDNLTNCIVSGDGALRAMSKFLGLDM